MTPGRLQSGSILSPDIESQVVVSGRELCAVRLRVPSTLLSLVLLTLPLGVAAVHGDDQPKPTSAEPALVLTVANLDEALADVDDLLRAGDGGPYADFVRGFIGGLNDLRGIDRERPLAGMLFLHVDDPDRKPSPLICLPVTDLPALQQTITTTGNSLDATDDARVYRLKLGQDDLRLLLAEGYAFITALNAPPPPYSPAHLLEVIDQQETSRDLSLRLRRAGIPPIQIKQLLAEFEADAARELARTDNETDEEFRLRTDVQRAVFDLIRLVLVEGQEFTATVDVNVDEPLTATVSFRAQVDGELAPWLTKSLTPPRRLAPPAEPHPALRFQAAGTLSGPGREMARRALAMIQREMQQDFGDEVPVDVREQIERAFDAFEATASTGHLETRLEFLPTPSGRFVLLAGLAAEQAESIDGAFRALIPLAEGSGDLQRVDLESFRVGEVAFHRIEGKQSRERDRKLYGADLAMYFAAGDRAVWFALGGGETAEIVSAVLGNDSTAPPASAPASLSLRVAPWAAFAAREGQSRQRRLAELVGEALINDDVITAALDTTDNSLTLSVEVDEAYVRLLARLAILNARQQN